MEDEVRRPWYQGLTRYQWTVLIIAALGWLFDTMDQNLFNLVRQPAVTSLLYPGVHDLVRAQVDHVAASSGNVTAIFLIGWAVGGLFFGIVGDRIGRTRTMMLTIAIYAIFTGLSGLTHSLFTFTLFRFLTALGVGGEWAAGAALVAEVFPPRSRARALSSLQASSALGNMLAALVTLCLPILLIHFSIAGDTWRWAFALGALPAIVVLFIRRNIREPESWQAAKNASRGEESQGELGAILELFQDPTLRRNTIAAILMAIAGVGGFWGIAVWSPELAKEVLKPLKLSPSQFDRYKSVLYLIQNFGALFGAYLYGAFAERTNRRFSLSVFFALAFASIEGMFLTAHSLTALIAWAPIMGFCTLGPFAAYTVYFPELFPTRLRATGCGVGYNCARFIAAAAPFATGQLTHHFSFRTAAGLVAFVYIFGFIGVAIAPETRGKPLPL